MALSDDAPKAWEVAQVLREHFGKEAPDKAAEMIEYAKRMRRRDAIRDIALAEKMMRVGTW